MAPSRAGSAPTKSASAQWSIPSKLTLAVLPILVAALLACVLLVWGAVSEGPDLSTTDILAIALAVVVAVVAVGSMIAVYRIGRSMSRRLLAVSSAARRMTEHDLAGLLDTMRSPESDLPGHEPPDLDTHIEDEVGEVARAYHDLHSSLVETAVRQMETLRNGVSAIFVTMARRNSSLVDRQLALLDELESREEDPETLGGFYRIDHLAARMRRNAESLLVLAGSESPRVWARATDISDVVRAAVSEVDEYQRIEVLALEPARLAGGAGSDVAHLLAELLENAVQFSAPSETVRVTGLFNVDGYQLSVSDRGVGITEARVGEFNRILTKPPSIGLSVEPTLGLYVVAKLAHRHGLSVELVPGVPGLTAKVTIPRERLEAMMPAEPRAHGGDQPTSSTGPSSPDRIDLQAARREFLPRSRRATSLGRTVPGDVDLPVLQPATDLDQPDEVIDLTQPAMTEADTQDDGQLAPTPSGDLPVRTPGMSFQDDDGVQSVVPGEGPATIRSALLAYDRGRSAAETGDRDEAEGASEDRE